MHRLHNLFTIIGFKITWISCVFGEVYINSLFGFFVGLFFLTFFFAYQNNRFNTFKLILLFSIPGYIFDSSLNYFGLYKINSEVNIFLLPIWFLVLWPSFSCLFVKVFNFLKNYKSLAFISGFIFGPITYYAGISMSLAKAQGYESFFLIGIFWGLMMLFYSYYDQQV